MIDLEKKGHGQLHKEVLAPNEAVLAWLTGR